MYYCKQCSHISQNNSCDNCGNTNLQQFDNADFVVLAKLDCAYANMLKSALDEHDVPSVVIANGSTVTTAFAVQHNNYNVLVPAELYQKASDIMNSVVMQTSEQYLEQLKDNLDKVHITDSKCFDKVTRKLQLSSADQLLAFCRDAISQASTVTDQGIVTGCNNGGHYLLVTAKECTLLVNSATFELLTVNLR